MKRLTTLLLVASLAAVSAQASELACTKIGFEPGTPDPNHCVVIGDPREPIVRPGLPTAPSAPASARTANSNATADVSNALTIGGDTNRSTVAVFPAPSTAAVPVAQACIVTRSTAGGIGWNLFQGATSEQYSDPLCVLQWLAGTATDAAERAAMRAEIAKRLGVQ